MFLIPEQVEQIQTLCEKVADNNTRSGKVTIEIQNNMPRNIYVEEPVYNEDHVLLGYTIQLYRVALPKEELERGRQKNRMPGKRDKI
jgi:hypothetical protein